MDFLLFTIPVSFLAACILIEATPGPNMTYLVLLSLSHGRHAGYAAAAGIALGLLIMGIVATFGAISILVEMPSIYNVLRIAGFLYLLWLAWDAWRVPNSADEKNKTLDKDLLTYFTRGLVTNLLNPKAALFYIAVLPNYIDINQTASQQTLIMTITYVFIATIVHASIISIAGTQKISSQTYKRKEVRGFFSISLVLTAVWFLHSTQT